MELLKVYLNDAEVARRQTEKLGLAPRTMNREIDRMVRRIAQQDPLVAARLSARFPSPCYAWIVEGIHERSGQLVQNQ